MRILIGMIHPKNVHFWRNIINNLVNHGHEIKIVAWDKDITLNLLSAYGLRYELIGKNYKGMMKKAYGMFTSDMKLLKIASRFRPDILLGGAPYLAHVSKLIGKPHISFIDTEHATLANWLSSPFSDVICTPSCYKGKFNEMKHIRYNGYMELAYLHPNYFKPDPSVLDEIGLTKDEKFIIIRLISWDASHDTQYKGLSHDYLKRAIILFEKYGRIFITSEHKLSKDFEKYEIQFPHEKLHSALFYSSLYFGEGGSTAVESALLGIPSVHVEAFRLKTNKVVDATKIHGNFDELVNKYEMLYTFFDENQALDKAIKLLNDKNIKINLGKKRNRLLSEKVDVTALMTEFIEKHPNSFHEYKSIKRNENGNL